MLVSYWYENKNVFTPDVSCWRCVAYILEPFAYSDIIPLFGSCSAVLFISVFHFRVINFIVLLKPLISIWRCKKAQISRLESNKMHLATGLCLNGLGSSMLSRPCIQLGIRALLPCMPSAFGSRWTTRFPFFSLQMLAFSHFALFIKKYTSLAYGRVSMLSAFGKRCKQTKQCLVRWVEHQKWCWIESAYAKHMHLLYFFAYRFTVTGKSSDVGLVRISEKVKQSYNFIYAITKYVSLPLTLSSLTITVTK